jgi:adenylate kinase
MKNIILIGPPGAGKGTQAKMIAKNLGLIHISTGDLIREEQKNDTKIGKLATQMIDKGHFLPDEIVIQMVKQKIIDNPKAEGFIFDGFPRTVDQAKILDEFLNLRKTPINKVILLEADNEVIVKRITERATIENRPDDSPEVIQVRIDTYNKQTVPVLNYFKEGYLFAGNRGVESIDASQTKEEIFTNITTILA